LADRRLDFRARRPISIPRGNVDGTYSKYGLDVTIVPGGPQSNGALLLLYGKLEFYMGSDMIGIFH
jgi:hypothetical protein